MQVVSYSDLRRDMKTIMDKVQDRHEPAIVTRKHDGHMVLMSLDDYNAIEETAYLLSNPDTAVRLMKGIEDVKAGKVILKDIKDFDV
jgi:antitoxin YefM